MRPLLATLAVLFLLPSSPALAVEGETLAVCEQPSNDEREAAVILSRWMRSARVEVRSCARGPVPPRRLAFVPGPEGSVLVRLETPTAAREREVPWLESTEAALAQLRTKGALARFSVIVEALLAEDRLATPVTPVVVSPRSVAKRAAHKAPVRPVEPPPAPTVPASTVGPIAPPPVPIASIPEPGPGPFEAGGPAAATPATPAEPEPSAPPSTPAASTTARRWAFGIDGGAAYHLRSPNLNTWEFGGGLHYGPLRFAVTYQPEASWDISGRKIGLNVLAFALGGRFALFESGEFQLGVLGNALLDYLVVWRKDTPGVVNDTDFGISGGVFGASRLGPTGAELRLEGIVMPTAHTVQIPDVGARQLNLVGLRVTLSLFWDLWQPT